MQNKIRKLIDCYGCMHYTYHTIESSVVVCNCIKPVSAVPIILDKENEEYVVFDCPKQRYTQPKVKFKKLNDAALLPVYATEEAAGFDFYAVEDIVIPAGETRIVKTGLACELPAGYEMQIRPRSGLSAKTGLRIANAPGTIDSDYRGEIGIIVWNTESKDYEVEKGTRIAQGVVAKVERLDLVEIVGEDELSSTARGAGGFGHTGTK